MSDLRTILANLVAALPRCHVGDLDTHLRDVECPTPATRTAYDYRHEVAVCEAHASEIARMGRGFAVNDRRLGYADALDAAVDALAARDRHKTNA